MPIGSVLLYWSGMALNDWSDREVDAVERPERVIPTGRVSAGSALGVAAALGAAGLVATALVGGRAALRTSVPLAVLIAAYDLLAKDSAAGPVVMASTRGLDVLLGATAGGVGAATAPAVSVAVHTFGVTVLSRGEVHGTHAATAALALAATATATGLLVATPQPTAVVRTGSPWSSDARRLYAVAVVNHSCARSGPPMRRPLARRPAPASPASRCCRRAGSRLAAGSCRRSRWRPPDRCSAGPPGR